VEIFGMEKIKRAGVEIMQVYLIDRKGIKHIGIIGPKNKLYSVCSNTWYSHDETKEGPSESVTCKKCLKILSRADEEGRVKL